MSSAAVLNHLKDKGILPLLGIVEADETYLHPRRLGGCSSKDGEWYFSIVDVIEAMVETASPSRYWAQLRDKLTQKEGFADLFDNIEKVKMPGRDGKTYPTESCDAPTLFRIIQSIPSPKADPFKRWLAKVAFERVQEFQNPELAIKRAMLDYQVQGRDGGVG